MANKIDDADKVKYREFAVWKEVKADLNGRVVIPSGQRIEMRVELLDDRR